MTFKHLRERYGKRQSWDIGPYEGKIRLTRFYMSSSVHIFFWEGVNIWNVQWTDVAWWLNTKVWRTAVGCMYLTPLPFSCVVSNRVAPKLFRNSVNMADRQCQVYYCVWFYYTSIHYSFFDSCILWYLSGHILEQWTSSSITLKTECHVKTKTLYQQLYPVEFYLDYLRPTLNTEQDY